jgi:hypothetical protein
MVFERYMYFGNLLSILLGTTIIPSIFQKVGSVAINLRHSPGIRNGNVVWCNPDVSAEFLMSLVDCKIMVIFGILEDSPQRGYSSEARCGKLAQVFLVKKVGTDWLQNCSYNNQEQNNYF